MKYVIAVIQPDSLDVQAWVEAYDLTHVVVSDPLGVLNPWLLQAGSWPTVPLLDSEHRVLHTDIQDTEQIRELLADP